MQATIRFWRESLGCAAQSGKAMNSPRAEDAGAATLIWLIPRKRSATWRQKSGLRTASRDLNRSWPIFEESDPRDWESDFPRSALVIAQRAHASVLEKPNPVLAG